MRIALILAVILATPVLAHPAAASAEVPRVVTDFGVVQSIVMDVMGDLGTPEMLLPAGGDPHDFQLRPSQAQMLQDADVVFSTGPDLMPSLGDALSALSGTATVLGLLAEGGGQARAYDDGGIDPHGWLNPANGAAWAGRIAAVLADKDPAHAATYAANATALQARLSALDRELATILTPVKDRPFVVYHDALGHFTDHYGLAVAGAIELGDASGPSAARLSDIGALLQDTGAVCVFPELGRDPKFITTLTEGLAVRIGAPQDLEFIARAAGPGQYEAMLRDLATGIADCLTGG